MRKNKYPIPENLTKRFEGNFLRVYFGKRKTNKMNLVRKHRPYGKVRIHEVKEFLPDNIDICVFGLPSKFGNTRNRKATRRIYNKMIRAQYKRELFSEVENYYNDPEYSAYAFEEYLAEEDARYNRIMNREVEDNLFEDSPASWYDPFDYEEVYPDHPMSYYR